MRTIEQQEKNIRNARAYASYEVTEAIRTSGYGEADKETMITIINASRNKTSMRLYNEADTAVRESLQEIIEKTYYGKATSGKNQYKASQFAKDVLINAIKNGKMETAQQILSMMDEKGMTIKITEPTRN